MPDRSGPSQWRILATVSVTSPLETETAPVGFHFDYNILLTSTKDLVGHLATPVALKDPTWS